MMLVVTLATAAGVCSVIVGSGPAVPLISSAVIAAVVMLTLQVPITYLTLYCVVFYAFVVTLHLPFFVIM